MSEKQCLQCWYLDDDAERFPNLACKMSRENNHNNVAQKLKEIIDIHRNKIELEKYI